MATDRHELTSYFDRLFDKQRQAAVKALEPLRQIQAGEWVWSNDGQARTGEKEGISLSVKFLVQPPPERPTPFLFTERVPLLYSPPKEVIVGETPIGAKKGKEVRLKDIVGKIPGLTGDLIRQADVNRRWGTRFVLAFLPIPPRRNEWQPLFHFGTEGIDGEYTICVLAPGGKFMGFFMSGIDIMALGGEEGELGFLFNALSVAQMTDHELSKVSPDSGLIRFLAVPVLRQKRDDEGERSYTLPSPPKGGDRLPLPQPTTTQSDVEETIEELINRLQGLGIGLPTPVPAEKKPPPEESGLPPTYFGHDSRSLGADATRSATFGPNKSASFDYRPALTSQKPVVPLPSAPRPTVSQVDIRKSRVQGAQYGHTTDVQYDSTRNPVLVAIRLLGIHLDENGVARLPQNLTPLLPAA